MAIDGLSGKRVESADLPILETVILSRNDLMEDLRGIRVAILATSEISEGLLDLIIEEHAFRFNKLLLVADEAQSPSLWVETCDLGQLLALEVRQNLLAKWQRIMKRTLDIGIILIIIY